MKLSQEPTYQVVPRLALSNNGLLVQPGPDQHANHARNRMVEPSRICPSKERISSIPGAMASNPFQQTVDQGNPRDFYLGFALTRQLESLAYNVSIKPTVVMERGLGYLLNYRSLKK